MCKKIRSDTKFYESSGFKELERQWNEILQADGFQDVERVVAGDRVLAQRSDYSLHQIAATELRAEYYRLLGQCLHDEMIESELDRIILSRLADGLKIAAISNELKQLGQRWHRQTIRFRIRKYENKFGIRKWEEHQLNPSWKNGKKKIPIQS